MIETQVVFIELKLAYEWKINKISLFYKKAKFFLIFTAFDTAFTILTSFWDVLVTHFCRQNDLKLKNLAWKWRRPFCLHLNRDKMKESVQSSLMTPKGRFNEEPTVSTHTKMLKNTKINRFLLRFFFNSRELSD